jgi:hypothetical protein
LEDWAAGEQHVISSNRKTLRERRRNLVVMIAGALGR